jgi:hypothetical protein
MKNIYFLSLIVFALVLTNCADSQSNAQVQSNAETQSNTKALSKSFLEMTEKEKADFAAVKTDEITQKISGKKYPFDADFQAQVLKSLEAYASRVGNNIKDRPFGNDLNFVFQRGAEFAPTINAAFDKQGVSRLSGLYMAMIETEFNGELVSPTGSSGVFQLTAAQAKRFGMEKKDLADLNKAAEIAARLIIEDQKKFDSDNMKEFLAILSHNREPEKIAADLKRKPVADGKDCSICAMTKNASALDEQFQIESVKYIPKFLAAAIIGENPADFGLSAKPLSTLGAETSQTVPADNSDLNVSPDYWKSQLNRALEPRRAPVGLDIKGVTIPEELVGYIAKQRTTLEAMKTQNFAVPMDFFDLLERKLNKELVEVPAATGTYVLDVDRNVTDRVFTKFSFKDGATVPAADSESQKKMKELAGNLNLNLNVPNDRKQIRLHLMRMIYPKGKTVLEEIAAQYQAKFNRPLLVTSLVRSIDYQIDLSKVDAGAFLVKKDGTIPPHCSGMAFDIAVKNLTAEEQNFIANILAEMDRNGKVDAIRETGPTGVFHVFVL